MITLRHGGAVHTLPQDLVWTDAFKWSSVAGSREYSTTGALLIDLGTRQAGRPITLEGSERHALLTLTQAEEMRALAAMPDAVMTLTLHDGSAYQVVFDHSGEQSQPFEATPWVDYSDPIPKDWYVPVFRFIEVGA